MLLTDRVALVCGSTQGIGLASAHALAEAGATVWLLARDAGRLEQTRGSLPRPAGQAHGSLTADFARPGEVRAVVDRALAAGTTFHVLVNNTGGPPAGPIVDATPDQFTAAFAAHLLVNQLLAQAVLPGMRAGGYGRIINVVSTSVRQPIKGLGVSNTIRAAVAGWAKTLAGEVARYGITVNNVLPGATRTGRLDAMIQHRAGKLGQTPAAVEADLQGEIPMGRFGRPEEVAAAVRFLASPEASYITGVSLPVDGGRISAL